MHGRSERLDRSAGEKLAGERGRCSPGLAVYDRSSIRTPDRKDLEGTFAGQAITPGAMHVIEPDRRRHVPRHEEPGRHASSVWGESPTVPDTGVVECAPFFSAQVGDEQPTRARLRPVDNGAVRRYVELGEPCPIGPGHLIPEPARLVQKAALREVHALYDQASFANVIDAVSDNARARSFFKQWFRIDRVESPDEQGSIHLFEGQGEVDESIRARNELRPGVPVLARLHFRHRRRGAAVLADSIDLGATSRPLCEQDEPVTPRGDRADHAHVADLDRRAAPIGKNLPKFSSGREPDPTSIR